MTTEATETKITDDAPNVESSSPGLGLSRGNLLLLGLVIVQAGLAAFMLWPRSTVGEAGMPLLGDLETSAISGLAIVEGEEEISFEKVGGDWAIAGTGGYLTNNDSDGANKVAAVLGKLLAIDGNRLVTQTPSSHKRLQVAADDFVRKVTLTTSDGNQTLYIGSSAGSGATHVRLDGSDEAYLTNEISSFELSTTASSWIDTQYYSVESSDVTAFTLENGNGSFVFERGDAEPAGEGDADNSPGPWTLADLAAEEALDQTKINTFVNQVTNLRMTQPVGTGEEAAFGLDSAAATLTLTVQESGEDANPEPQTVTLRIGSSPENETDRYAKISASEFIVLISEFNANQVLDKARADFMVDPEPDESTDAGAVETDTAAPDIANEPDSEPEVGAVDLSGTDVESVDAGGTFTITEPLTATGVISVSTGLTDTGNITSTEPISVSTEIIDDGVEQSTEPVSSPAVVTDTETVTLTEPISVSAGITEAGTLTSTEPISVSTVLTETVGITATETLTD